MLISYNKRWGRPTKKQKYLLIKQINKILNKKENINSWINYFNEIGNKYKTNENI